MQDISKRFGYNSEKSSEPNMIVFKKILIGVSLGGLTGGAASLADHYIFPGVGCFSECLVRALLLDTVFLKNSSHSEIYIVNWFSWIFSWLSWIMASKLLQNNYFF